ncbi:MAG: DUF721 domain-containing protein [Flavobacteriales bacterium]|nr:DUF721 domain-containing protein [Flavobacteriales bacterium]
MRKSNEQSLGEVIKELLKSSGLDKKLAQHKLIEGWAEVVGETIARHTLEVKIFDDKLYVKMNSSVIREELNYVKSGLVQKLNELAGEKLIEDIVIR